MVKKRYTFSSSDDEPPGSPARGRKRPSLPAPQPRTLRTKPHIDLSSDDDLFQRRPKDNSRGIKAGPSTSKRDLAENSSSESEFEFNYKKALKRHNERRQRKEKDNERNERGSDGCSSCSGSVCGDCTKAGTKKRGKLLARIKNEGTHGNELVQSQELVTKSVARRGELAKAPNRRLQKVGADSMESSDDDGLMASKSYRLLERHLRRKESERGENQAFSTNDEPLRKTFEENLTPRKQANRRFVWESDSGEELAVRHTKHDRPHAVPRSLGVVVHTASKPLGQSSARRVESEEDSDDDFDVFDRNLGKHKPKSPRPKGDIHLSKVPGFKRREHLQPEHNTIRSSQHSKSENANKPKRFTFHKECSELNKPIAPDLEDGRMDCRTSSEQMPTVVWDRKKHKESLARLSDAAPREWRPARKETFAEVNDSASGRYKDVSDGVRGHRVYVRDQATSPIKSRAPSPEKGIGIAVEHDPINTETFAKVAGAACTVLQSPSRHIDRGQSPFRHHPQQRDVAIPQGRSRSTRRTCSPSQRTHSAPASECRDMHEDEHNCRRFGTNSTSHKQSDCAEDAAVQRKSTDSRQENAFPQDISLRERHQSEEHQPYSDDSYEAQGAGEAFEARKRSVEDRISTSRPRDFDDLKPNRSQAGTSHQRRAEDHGATIAPITAHLDLFDKSKGESPRHAQRESAKRIVQPQPLDEQNANVLLEKTVSEAVRIVGDKLIAKMAKRDSKVEGLMNGCMDNCVQLGGEISDLRCNVQASTARQDEKIRRLVEEARPINEAVKELQEKFHRNDSNDGVGKTSHILKDLSIRLDHLESRMVGQLSRLQRDAQQTTERTPQRHNQPSSSQEGRLQDLENTIHELKNTIRSPKNVAQLEQEIRRVQGEVGQCLEEVVDCRSENKGSLIKIRDAIGTIEDDFRRTTSETRSKIEFLETKMGTVHDRVRGLEKAEASAKSGIRRTEHKIENVEILVEQVAAACNATVKAVDQKHLRFKNSLRVIKEAAAVTNAKCDALAEAMAKLHKDTVGKTEGKPKAARDTEESLSNAQEIHRDREYLAHVTVERTGKERRSGDVRKQHQYLVKDKGPILQTPGARTVEVIPSKPPVDRFV